MAESVTVKAGTTGSDVKVAADQIATEWYQRVKLTHGVDGTAVDVSAGSPLETQQTGGLPAGTNNIGDVDVVTLPSLPAGTNNIGDVDVLTLPALPAGTNNIGDVDIASAIPAGDNAIGRVKITDGTDVALVDASGRQLVDASGVAVPVTDNAGSLTVDAPAATPVATAVTSTADALVKPGDVANNAVRVNVVAGAAAGGTSLVDDAAFTPGTTAVTPAAGVYRSTRDLVDDNDAGAVAMTQRRAQLVALETPLGDTVIDDTLDTVRVSIISGAGSGGTAAVDDTAFVAATTSVTPIGAFADETGPDSVDEGDVGAVRMSLNRSLFTQIRDGQNNERALRVDANGAIAVTQGAIAAGTNNIGDVDVLTLPPLVAGTANIGDVDVLSLPALPAGANNIGDVDVLTLPALPAGTNNIGDVDVLTLPALPAGANAIGSVITGGAVAHDAADSGNPDKIGGKASLNEPTAVTDGDRVNAWFDLSGRQVVTLGHGNPEAPVTLNATASGDTTVIAAPGASVSIYVCKASVHNRAATNRRASLRDGTAGTIRWAAELAAEGGGSLVDFGSRGWKLTANTLLAVNLDAAGDVDVNITEYYLAA